MVLDVLYIIIAIIPPLIFAEFDGLLAGLITRAILYTLIYRRQARSLSSFLNP